MFSPLNLDPTTEGVGYGTAFSQTLLLPYCCHSLDAQGALFAFLLQTEG